jgi:hypothetical protein
MMARQSGSWSLTDLLQYGGHMGTTGEIVPGGAEALKYGMVDARP